MHNATVEAMKKLTWGVEIECVGLPRYRCAEVVAAATGGRVEGEAVVLTDGRRWNIVRDGSLSGGELSAEVVSPIMKWEDMEMFQKVIRALRTAGARVDSSCGQHVHVGLQGVDSKGVANVLRTAYRFEEVIIAAGGVQERRLNHYCKRTSAEKVEAISKGALSVGGLNRAWYGREVAYPTRYDSSRYHGVNLNSFFLRGTVEFRWFEGTLHAGEARANVTTVLGLVAYAITGKRFRKADRVIDPKIGNKIEPVKGWMEYLLFDLCGLRGPEFTAVVEHMTKRLPAAVVDA